MRTCWNTIIDRCLSIGLILMMSCLAAVASQTVDLIMITEGGSGNSIVNNGANPAEVAVARPVTFSAAVSGDGNDAVEWTVAKVGSLGSSDGAPVGMGIGEKVTYAFGEEGRYWVKASAGQNSEIMYVLASAEIASDHGEALAYGYGEEGDVLTVLATAACTSPSDGDSCAEVTLDLGAAKDIICIHETVSITVNSTCHDPAPGTGSEPWSVTLTISGASSANVTSGSGTTSTNPSGAIVVTGSNTISVTVTPGSAGSGAISAIAKTTCSEGHHLTAQVEVDVIKIEITGKDSYVPYLGADPIGTLKADEKPTGGTQLWSDPTGRLSFSDATALTTPITGAALGVAKPEITYTLGCATCVDTGTVGVWEYEFDTSVPSSAVASAGPAAMAAAAPSYAVCIKETKVIKAKLKAGAPIPAGKYKWTVRPKLGKFNPVTGALANILTTTFTAGKKSGLGKIKLVPVDEAGAVKNEGVVLEADLAVVEVDFVSVFRSMACVEDSIFCTAQSDPPNMWPDGRPVWDSGIDAGAFDPTTGTPTEYTQTYPSATKDDVTITAKCGSSSASHDVTFVKLTMLDATGNNGDQSLGMGLQLEPSAVSLGITPTATSDNDDIVVSSVTPFSVTLSIGDDQAYNDAGNRNALNGGAITIIAGPCTETPSISVWNRMPEVIDETIPTEIIQVLTPFTVTVGDLEHVAHANIHINGSTFLALVNAILTQYPGVPPITITPYIDLVSPTTPYPMVTNPDGSVTYNQAINYPVSLSMIFEAARFLFPNIPGFECQLDVTPVVFFPLQVAPTESHMIDLLFLP